MRDTHPGPVIRVFRGLWDALNFSRLLVFNIIFLIIIALVIAALFAEPALTLQPKTALVLAPSGELVEEFRTDPVSRAVAKALGEQQPETRLRDVLRAIKVAATDDRIERIVIEPQHMTSAGMASLREIGRALTEFKKSGKPVIAYADGMQQQQYYLAAHADTVYLHPEGAILLEGLSRYRMYFREALEDKLGVDVHLFRVGEFKSAAEPYILDAPSEESKASDLYWMSDLWQRYLAEIGAARGIDPAALEADIAAIDDRVIAVGGDLGELALSQKLVDELKTEDQIRSMLIADGAENDDGTSFRQISLEGLLEAHRESPTSLLAGDTIAVVVAQGEIVDGDQPAGVVGGVSTARLIRKAREDDAVKAMVLRVDSPGGGVFPSEQIRREVELFREAGKPVVVSMGDVAASGGYWISMDANEILADPSTITGSIGIFGLFMTFPDTLAKLGIHTGGVGTTPIAGAFDPTRELDPRVGRLIDAVIQDGYAEFIGKVAKARGMTPLAVDEVARGRVWSGQQAFERGLVDGLGGLEDAVAAAMRLADLDGEPALRYMERDQTPLDAFLAKLGQGSVLGQAVLGGVVGQWAIGHPAAVQIERGMQFLERAREQPLARYAHCLCDD